MRLLKTTLFIALTIGVATPGLASVTVTKTMSAATNTLDGLRGSGMWQPSPSTNTLLQCVDSNDGVTSFAFAYLDTSNMFSGSSLSHYLDMTGFFTSTDVPAGSTIDGVQVTINRRITNVMNPFGTFQGFKDNDVEILNISGSLNEANGSSWPTSFGAQTYGGSGDLWTVTMPPRPITQAEVVSSDFGVRLQVKSTQNSDNGDQMNQGEVTYVTMSVTYG